MLRIKNLKSSVDKKEVLKGVSLTIKPGGIHAIIGPNGSGKTTLAMSMMGHPSYKFPISNFQFQINGVEMKDLRPEERAKHGLFVSFQNPIEITGVTFLAFLRTAAKALRPAEKIPLSQFKQKVIQALQAVDLDEDFMKRSVNEGFSGGERKRAEIAQMLVLKPKFVVLDEIDSGLDMDSIRIVAKVIRAAAEKEKVGMLLITHYQRILQYLKLTSVHVLIDGKIKATGGMALVEKVEKDGYAAI
ncbi:MAG TPA: Fe-S cluster assembly ATPase SufC [Patescibacteria group bacterium]|nr:Fe-S cluster assembly ATPase SufC [Patescibacteria group bacterium]